MLYRSLFQRVLGAAAVTVAAARCAGAESAPEVAEQSSELVVATFVTISEVSFPGPPGQQLSGVLYKPAHYPLGSEYPAVVMMHGCSGMWSSSIVGAANPDGSPNLQGHIEKWGRKLAANGIVALAVDSFTDRAAAAGATENAFQHQCSGNAYAGAVNPYTTRALDVRHAKDYLVGLGTTDESRVGLLGWSHGAQAAMVEVAVTERTSAMPRLVVGGDHGFRGTVLYYPGCGPALGYVSGGDVTTSWWRPSRDAMLHVGTNDAFFTNCEMRADRAIAVYGSTNLEFHAHQGASHSFEGSSEIWPNSKCAGPAVGDDCAKRAADIDSLAFFQDLLQ